MGSKFALLHWLSRSPLTQCSRYRAACDAQNTTISFSNKDVTTSVIDKLRTETSCVAAGCGRHGNPPIPRLPAKTQLHSFIAGRDSLQRMHWGTNSEVRISFRSVDRLWYSFALSSSWPIVTALVLSAIRVFVLRLWPWNCCALLPVECATVLPILVFLSFRSRLIGQHLSDASRDIATLTFDLGGHCACRWCGSSCCVCIPSLKFIGLPVRRYWTFTAWALVGLVTMTFRLFSKRRS